MSIVVACASLAVGLLIGIAGIAGFLLPIIFTGFLQMPLPDALALSFVAFLTSGILGAWSYRKQGELDMRTALPLCAGSLVGALAGVLLAGVIPVPAAKLLLYAVVLASGISILMKKERPGETQAVRQPPSAAVLLVIGLTTGAVCSLTGAGGPILVMPILVCLGIPLRMAVGVSLLDSVAIALPACVGYLSRADMTSLLPLCLLAILFHGGGVLFGARLAGKVNLKLLRLGVGWLAVIAACYMLAQLWFSR